jgi:hypothetical protein
VKKLLLIGLGIVLVLLSLPIILIKFAFGPLHDLVTIDLGEEGTLYCEETYNGDLAGVFYDVKIILKTSKGKTFNMGTVTFNDEKWDERISVKRIDDWLMMPLDPGSFLQMKMINTTTGQLNDTILKPFDLRKDIVYKQKFEDNPGHLYPGTSKIRDILQSGVEVTYEYKVKAEYPTEVLVAQKILYELDSSTGQLETKKVFERVLQ